MNGHVHPLFATILNAHHLGAAVQAVEPRCLISSLPGGYFEFRRSSMQVIGFRVEDGEPRIVQEQTTDANGRLFWSGAHEIGDYWRDLYVAEIKGELAREAGQRELAL